METTESTQTLKLKCPICDKKHLYLLKLTQSPIIYQITAMNYDWRKNHQDFSRIFICQQTRESFKTSFKVEVSGIVNSLNVEEPPKG